MAAGALAGDVGELGTFVIKVKRWFKNSLEEARDSGCLARPLWFFLTALAHLHDADIQFLEGLNSKIKINRIWSRPADVSGHVEQSDAYPIPLA